MADAKTPGCREIINEIDLSGIQAIIDAIPSYVMIVDEKHHIVCANKVVTDGVRLNPKTIAGAYCPKLIHGHDKPFHGCPLEESLTINGSVEKDIFDPDSDKWVKSSIYPMNLVTAKGTRLFLHIVNDITEEKATKEKQVKLDRQVKLILDSTSQGIYGVDIDGSCTFVNKAAAELTGYDAEEVLGKNVHNVIHYKKIDGSSYPIEECHLSKALHAGVSVRVDDEMFWKKSGDGLPIEYSSNPIIEDGTIKGAVVTFTDISERKKIERDLRKSEERFRTIVEQSKDGIIMESSEGRIVLYNKSAETILGYSIEEVNDHGLFPLIIPDDIQREAITVSIQDALRGNMPYVEARITKRDGLHAWISFSVSPITIDGAKYNLAIVTDITKRKEAEEMVNYMAYYDVLTGLPNKALLLDRLNSAISAARLENKSLAVLHFALDNYKAIIDTLGHGQGDGLLKDAVFRFANMLSDEKTLAYLGGGEFALLMPNINSEEEPAKFAEAIYRTLKPSFRVDGHEVHLSVNIGISLCPEDGVDSHALLRNAATAQNRAREKGKNYHEFYEMSMNSKSIKRLSIESKLHKALDKGEFLLYYQPQVEIGTNRISGLEALIRWQNHDLGFVSPLDFISIAEDTGLIVPIGEWVLREACEQNMAWQRQGCSPVRIGVNLSARQFQQKDLVTMIRRTLAETGLDPSYLELEITESVVMREADVAVNALRKLKDMGIKVAIDDFGTGYSSLGYLKRFPIDRLKIDKVFIDNITSEHNDRAIVEAIISMSHTLGLEVVAEGVETQEQLELLHSLTCNEMQGYLFSKPLPSSEIEKLFRQNDLLCA